MDPAKFRYCCVPPVHSRIYIHSFCILKFAGLTFCTFPHAALYFCTLEFAALTFCTLPWANFGLLHRWVWILMILSRLDCHNILSEQNGLAPESWKGWKLMFPEYNHIMYLSCLKSINRTVHMVHRLHIIIIRSRHNYKIQVIMICS